MLYCSIKFPLCSRGCSIYELFELIFFFVFLLFLRFVLMFAPLGGTDHKIHIKTIIFIQRSPAAQVCEALEASEKIKGEKKKRKDVNTDQCDHVTVKTRQDPDRRASALP